MYRPSLLITGSILDPSLGPPPLSQLTSAIAPVMTSFTNTSYCPFVSPSTKFVAALENTT